MLGLHASYQKRTRQEIQRLETLTQDPQSRQASDISAEVAAQKAAIEEALRALETAAIQARAQDEADAEWARRTAALANQHREVQVALDAVGCPCRTEIAPNNAQPNQGRHH